MPIQTAVAVDIPEYFITDSKGIRIRNPEHIAYMEAKYSSSSSSDSKEEPVTTILSRDRGLVDDDNEDDNEDEDVETKKKSEVVEVKNENEEKEEKPKKYLKDPNTGTVLRNPEYDRFMMGLNITSNSHVSSSSSADTNDNTDDSDNTKVSDDNDDTKVSDNDANNNCIVDLSKDFVMQSNHLINPGSRLLEMDFKKFREVRRVTVIENGIIVADYKQKGVSAQDTYNLFSSTKAITSMLIGILINLPHINLSVTDTLEEIFQHNHNYAWSGIQNQEYNVYSNTDEYNYKKSIRLEEILTMTSGLKSMMGGVKGIINMKHVSVADAPGSNLPKSLAAPSYDATIRGKFHYMASSNILSYIIKEKSGLSPREFADKYVFQYIGIKHTAMKWDTNSDGIETSYSQLKLTTIQMCKVAQLYLQNGYSKSSDNNNNPSSDSDSDDNDNNNKQQQKQPIISTQWIQQTQGKHIFGNAGFDHWYGYLWALYDKKYHKQHTIDQVWVAPGFNGQMIALSKETNRVVAVSRLPTPMTNDNLLHYKQCIIKLLSPTRNYAPLSAGPENIPKKFIKKTNHASGKSKMIRNPEYDRFMESKRIHSDTLGDNGIQRQRHDNDPQYSGRRNSYTNPYI